LLDMLSTGNKYVGLNQTTRAVESDKAKVVYIANDAEERITTKLRTLCNNKSIQVVNIDTMLELGKACGVGIATAVACLVKENSEQ